MLINSLEIAWYSLLTAFCVVKGSALLDFLLDYNQYLWRFRYNKALKAAGKVGQDQVEQLKAALKLADESGSEKVNVMAEAYDVIAQQHYPFKLWTCIYCMTIRIGSIVVVLSCILLFALGYGWCSLMFIPVTMALIAYFLKIGN